MLDHKGLSEIGEGPIQIQKPASKRKRAFYWLDNRLNVGIEGSYSFTTKCTLRFFCMQPSLCLKQRGRSLP